MADSNIPEVIHKRSFNMQQYLDVAYVDLVDYAVLFQTKSGTTSYIQAQVINKTTGQVTNLSPLNNYPYPVHLDAIPIDDRRLFLNFTHRASSGNTYTRTAMFELSVSPSVTLIDRGISTHGDESGTQSSVTMYMSRVYEDVDYIHFLAVWKRIDYNTKLIRIRYDKSTKIYGENGYVYINSKYEAIPVKKSINNNEQGLFIISRDKNSSAVTEIAYFDYNTLAESNVRTLATTINYTKLPSIFDDSVRNQVVIQTASLGSNYEAAELYILSYNPTTKAFTGEQSVSINLTGIPQYNGTGWGAFAGKSIIIGDYLYTLTAMYLPSDNYKTCTVYALKINLNNNIIEAYEYVSYYSDRTFRWGGFSISADEKTASLGAVTEWTLNVSTYSYEFRYATLGFYSPPNWPVNVNGSWKDSEIFIKVNDEWTSDGLECKIHDGTGWKETT